MMNCPGEMSVPAAVQTREFGKIIGLNIEQKFHRV